MGMSNDTYPGSLVVTDDEVALKKAQKAKKKAISDERTFLAFDRTLLAWVRTSTSLLTFGFAIVKLLEQKVQEPGQHPILQFITPTTVGMLMIFSGCIGLAMAMTNYIRYARQFERKRLQIYFNPAMVVSYVVVLLCFMILIGAVVSKRNATL
jgi:putative membrane protein